MDRITFSNLLDSLNLDNIARINTDINIWMILMNLTVAFILVIFIYFIYRITFSGVLYSKNFNITLVMVSLVTTAVVMVISSNIVLALGMVGALSIVRFRMAVKDPKDVGYIFWAITNGIICGISAYSLAVISVLFIGLVVFLLSKKIRTIEPYLLIIDSKKMDIEKLDKILSQKVQLSKIRSKILDKEKSQIVIEVKLKKNMVNDLMESINELEEVKFAKLVSYEGDLEEG
jgi:uncharacterized membrane protein YhiD involved in acid resistance